MPPYCFDDFGQLDEVLRGRETRRRNEERRRQAHRAFFHRLRDELLHLVQLGRRGGRLAVALDVGPDLLLADVRRDVGRHLLALELLEVPAERRPIDGGAVGARARIVVRPGFHRSGRSRLAEHERRHALPDHALGLGLHEDRVVRVVVHVDEAGGHGEPLRIDPAIGRRAPQVADAGNLPVANADVGHHGRCPVAVEHRPLSDQQVIANLLSPWTTAHGQDACKRNGPDRVALRGSGAKHRSGVGRHVRQLIAGGAIAEWLKGLVGAHGVGLTA